MSILITHMDERGGDSFGYVADGKTVKDVGTAAAGVELEKIAEAKALIMHTRRATVGDVTAENSHPFQKGSIIGVHNGGVSNWRELNRELGRDFKVDSEHIFAHLDENRNLVELRAGGAIAFVEDEDLTTINICKFNGGSMVIMGIGVDGQTTSDIVFASTAAPLVSALNMAKVGEFFPFKMPEEDLFYTTDGRLYVHTPNIRLLFGPRYQQHTPTHRRGFNIIDNRKTSTDVMPPWGQGALYSDDEYEDSSVVGDTDKTDADAAATETPRSPLARYYDKQQRKSSEQGIATKHFLATRKKALEGYYGEVVCCLCRFMTANVKCTLTNLLYCINCWRYIEQISPFVEDSYMKLISDVIERDRKKTNTVPTTCERCLSEDELRKPRYFDTVQELVVCAQCTINYRYDMAKMIIMPGLGMAPTGQCCEVCDDELPKKGVAAEIKYISLTEGRPLWVCFDCFKGELEVDAATANRRLLGEGPVEKNVTPPGDKISARRPSGPVHITRPAPKVVEVDLPVDSNEWTEADPTTISPEPTEPEETKVSGVGGGQH